MLAQDKSVEAMMMKRLRRLAVEEQRQLITFAFSVAVFLLTLLALQLRGQSPGFNGSMASAATTQIRP